MSGPGNRGPPGYPSGLGCAWAELKAVVAGGRVHSPDSLLVPQGEALQVPDLRRTFTLKHSLVCRQRSPPEGPARQAPRQGQRPPRSARRRTAGASPPTAAAHPLSEGEDAGLHASTHVALTRSRRGRAWPPGPPAAGAGRLARGPSQAAAGRSAPRAAAAGSPGSQAPRATPAGRARGPPAGPAGAAGHRPAHPSCPADSASLLGLEWRPGPPPRRPKASRASALNLLPEVPRCLGCWGDGERAAAHQVPSPSTAGRAHQRSSALTTHALGVVLGVMCFQNDFLKNKANILMNYLERTFSFKH